MISFLQGYVCPGDFPGLVEVRVKTSRGVIGYEVRMFGVENAIPSMDVHIWHVITERDQRLYGFREQEDRRLAKMLAEAKGVGPSTAALTVQYHDRQELLEFITDKLYTAVAAKVPGVGPKAAKAMIEHMHSKWSAELPETDKKAIEAKRIIEALGKEVDMKKLDKLARKGWGSGEGLANAYING